MKKLKTILMAACFGVLCLGFGSQSWGAEWTFYYQSEIEDESKTIMEKYYYDKASVEKPQKNILKLTQKITILATGSEEADKKVMQIEINCSSHKYRIVSQTEYEVATGKVIQEGQVENAVWKRFDLESVLGGLSENLCFEKKQKKVAEKKPEKQKDKTADQPKGNESKK